MSTAKRRTLSDVWASMKAVAAERGVTFVIPQAPPMRSRPPATNGIVIIDYLDKLIPAKDPTS